VGAVLDLRTKKIPNWLTFSLLAVGIAVSGSIGDGWAFALYGAGVAFVLHFVLWQLGLEGAGDAKLMMAVGAFVGWQTMLEATLWRYVLLLPYAVVALTVLRKWGNFRAALHWTIARAQGVEVGERPTPTELPFGPLIAVAVPVAVYTSWLDFFGAGG
jgi:prepilin peptidase CpaA